MKKISLFILSTIFMSITLNAQTKTDSTEILNTVRNYYEGWYNSDTIRMDKALHPDLAKRKMYTVTQTGKYIINTLSKSNMIEYTRIERENPKDKFDNETIILDIFGNIASVKAVSYDYVDYLHLVKYNNEWKILNVLWEFRTKDKKE